MILVTFKIFALFVLSVSILPLYFLALRNYARSKRAVIEGMAQLDVDTRHQLVWVPKGYIGVFDLLAPLRLGWQSWGLMSQQQNLALQRVLLHGPPKNAELSGETKKSARRFRRYFCFFIAPLAVLILLSAYIRLSHDLADFSGMSLSICYLLLGFGPALWVFILQEKFNKWPEIEDRT